MDLRTYRFLERTTYKVMAKTIGIDKDYLSSIANGLRCGAQMAIKIEKGLDGKVSRSELRPDLWPPEPE